MFLIDVTEACRCHDSILYSHTPENLWEPRAPYSWTRIQIINPNVLKTRKKTRECNTQAGAFDSQMIGENNFARSRQQYMRRCYSNHILEQKQDCFHPWL